jgi:putative transposase
LRRSHFVASTCCSSSSLVAAASTWPVRTECLDWLLILGRRHLQSVLRVYTAHYNRERPHRGLALLTPETSDAAGLPTAEKIDRRDRLGGLIHEYHRAAA